MKQLLFRQKSIAIQRCMLIFTLALFAAVPVSAYCFGGWNDIIPGLLRIVLSPSPLVTDYFALGGVAASFLNAGLCCLACWAFVRIFRTLSTSLTLAGWLLVAAHCFYGLNIINMWPCFFGVICYYKFQGLSWQNNLHVCMFATAFGPFVSEFLFRCPLLPVGSEPGFTVLGLVCALVFGMIIGFALPAMLPGTAAMHKAYNLYNAGLSTGLLGFFLFALCYKTLGNAAPAAVSVSGSVPSGIANGHALFMICFFALFFGGCIITGWYENGRTFRGYSALLRADCHQNDFAVTFGVALCLINIGIYGLCILAYVSAVILIPGGVGFTGATVGVIFASLTFTFTGQHPRAVWPIMAGYAALFAIVSGVCLLRGAEIPWVLCTQGYINSFAFATGLCPISGRFGWKTGIFGGLVCAVLGSSTSVIHGGLVLYNGGFTAGIACLILVPILEHYFHVPAKERDEARL